MATIMGLTSSPIPIKAAVGMLGLEVGETRLPLVPLTPDERSTLRQALQEAGLI
jgi:4-hydroxy-tetrahydrodipicolinate synthase